MEYERLRELFRRKFPDGGFRSSDFRAEFGGFLHKVWVAIEPRPTPRETLVRAHDALAEACEFLRPLTPLFGNGDRILFEVGFERPVRRQILQGGLPAARLGDVRPPDFVAVGGVLGEMEFWTFGVWDEPIRDT